MGVKLRVATFYDCLNFSSRLVEPLKDREIRYSVIVFSRVSRVECATRIPSLLEILFCSLLIEDGDTNITEDANGLARIAIPRE